MFNWLTFKIPYTRVILTIIVQWQLLFFHKAKQSTNIYLEVFLEYQFSLRYQLPLVISEKKQTINSDLEQINSQDQTRKSDFETYYARTAFDLPEKLMATKIQMFLEYQFPDRHQLPQPFLKNLRRIVYIQLINIHDTIHKRDFDIDQMILNVTQKLAENQCMCGESWNISCPFLFPKCLRDTA